jgi:hypothetical protein
MVFRFFNRPILFTTLRPIGLARHILAGNPFQVEFSWDVTYARRGATSLFATQYRVTSRRAILADIILDTRPNYPQSTYLSMPRIFRNIRTFLVSSMYSSVA